jgi:serine/threonine protein phosphatase PrpC
MAKCRIYSRSKKSDDLFHRKNEDYMMYSKFNFLGDEDIDVIVLSDGMGGLENGEVASHAAVEGFMQCFYSELMKAYIPQRRNFTILHYCEQIRQVVITAMKAANQNVRNTAVSGIRTGATISVAVLVGTYLIIANVGDSPVYYYCAREKKMHLVSTLQTKAEQDYYAGSYERYSEKYYAFEHVLVYYIGQYADLPENVIALHIVEKVESGDIIFACSDGAVGYRMTDEIGKILTNNEPELALSELFEVAAQDKEDDQTAVFVQIV